MQLHGDMFYSFFTGGFAFTVLSYAAKSFPKPSNQYCLWILGVIQFILANRDLSKENFQTAALLNKE